MSHTLIPDTPALDTPAFGARVDAYVASLEALDREVEQLLAAVPAARRVLVTNHEPPRN